MLIKCLLLGISVGLMSVFIRTECFAQNIPPVKKTVSDNRSIQPKGPGKKGVFIAKPDFLPVGTASETPEKSLQERRWAPGHFEVIDGVKTWVPDHYEKASEDTNTQSLHTPQQLILDQQEMSTKPHHDDRHSDEGFSRPYFAGEAERASTKRWIPGHYEFIDGREGWIPGYYVHEKDTSVGAGVDNENIIKAADKASMEGVNETPADRIELGIKP